MPDLSSYRFTETHEWALIEAGEATVGITDHAQSQLGDVIFIELPALGTQLAAGQRFGVVESVKAASDLYAPVAGRVAAVNSYLSDQPETVNRDPYGEGWMVRLEAIEDNPMLLDTAAYEALAGH